MSDILEWATLDNSTALVLDATSNEYCTIGLEHGEKHRLMKSGVTETINTFKSDEVDGILNTSENHGTYKMLKCGFYGYKSGTLNSITLYFNGFANDNNANIDKLILGKVICKAENNQIQRRVTIMAHAELESVDDVKFTKTFKVKSNYTLQITPEMISDPKNGLLIIPTSREFDAIPEWTPSTSSNEITYSDTHILGKLSDTEKVSIKVLNSRSIYDAGTHLYLTSTSGSDLTPIYSAEVLTNLILDHTEYNFKEYHLDSSTITGINSLKFYSPILKSKNKSDVSNRVFSRCYISHNSLSLDNLIDINNKVIKSIQFPINTGDNWYTGHQNQLNYIGINNFEVYIAFSVDEPTKDNSSWIKADYTIAPKRADGYNVVWEVNFNNSNVQYPSTNTGIWIKVVNLDKPIADNGVDNADKQQIMCRTYNNANNASDKMYLHSNTLATSAECVNITPDIRIIFDFDARAEFMEMLYRKILALS